MGLKQSQQNMHVRTRGWSCSVPRVLSSVDSTGKRPAILRCNEPSTFEDACRMLGIVASRDSDTNAGSEEPRERRGDPGGLDLRRIIKAQRSSDFRGLLSEKPSPPPVVVARRNTGMGEIDIGHIKRLMEDAGRNEAAGRLGKNPPPLPPAVISLARAKPSSRVLTVLTSPRDVRRKTRNSPPQSDKRADRPRALPHSRKVKISAPTLPVLGLTRLRVRPEQLSHGRNVPILAARIPRDLARHAETLPVHPLLQARSADKEPGMIKGRSRADSDRLGPSPAHGRFGTVSLKEGFGVPVLEYPRSSSACLIRLQTASAHA